jgi:excisionase family DNA binding protein
MADSPHFRSHKLLSTVELAQLMRVTARTIRLWAETGRIRGIRVGRHWRFRQTDLARWMRHNSEQ